jgi:hypothetical protein
VAVRQCGSAWLCAPVRCVRQCAVCGSVRYYVAVCGSAPGIVCGNARGSVRAIAYGSALGSIWQCAVVCGSCPVVRQCAAVRLVVYSSAHGSAVWLCGNAVECGSVRQRVRQSMYVQKSNYKKTDDGST